MAKHRYTDSKDGVKRCNIQIRFRLTAEQIGYLEAYAAHKESTLHEVLQHELGLDLEGFIERITGAG